MSGGEYVIIGGGASGSIQAVHLLRRGALRVTLIERERVPGRGTAYGTRRPEHLLNVTAARMIVDPADPDHFARWVSASGGHSEDYAQRRHFGDYLRQWLLSAPGTLEIVAGEAVGIEPKGGGERVTLADGSTFDADGVVLALGNLRPAAPSPLRPETLPDIWVDDPWFGDIAAGLGPEDQVVMIGSGLTAVDAALTLEAAGFQGRILGLSRRGLVPRPHLPREPVAEIPGNFPARSTTLLRTVRRRSAEIGWREAVHEVRHAAQSLWMAASPEERSRFLRHLRPWWDVHRHRIAPAVAERIAALQEQGRLAFRAGRILSAEPAGDIALLRWRPRGSDRVEEVRTRRIVNCSGPELHIARAGEPLLDSLLAHRRIRPDRCRLGIDVDTSCRVIDADGRPSDSLYAIGPMTRGAFWESIAVTEIAQQANDLADRLEGARSAD